MGVLRVKSPQTRGVEPSVVMAVAGVCFAGMLNEVRKSHGGP